MGNVQIHISGKVFKTGFRYYLKQIAHLNHITGYVRYDKDQSLIVEAQGTEASINEFLKLCRLGHTSSLVEEVSIKEVPVTKFEGFEIIEHQKHNTHSS